MLEQFEDAPELQLVLTQYGDLALLPTQIACQSCNRFSATRQHLLELGALTALLGLQRLDAITPLHGLLRQTLLLPQVGPQAVYQPQPGTTKMFEIMRIARDLVRIATRQERGDIAAAVHVVAPQQRGQLFPPRLDAHGDFSLHALGLSQCFLDGRALSRQITQRTAAL